MMPYYIGDSLEYIAVQYAKSGRSSCKQCKQKIGKNDIRIGLLLDDDHFMASYWYHPNCFHFKPRHKVLDQNNLKKSIYGIQQVNKQDFDKIILYLNKQLQNLKNDKFKRSKSIKKIPEKIQFIKKQSIKQQTYSSTKPNKIKNKSKSKSLQPLITKQTKNKKTLKKNIKVEKQIKLITMKQNKIYKQLLNEYNQYNINQLKQFLSKNGQPKTGIKNDLVNRCADGKQFGRIPSCNLCGGGKLRFDRIKETYSCPGFMEDTDFVNCKANFKFNQIQRLLWVQ